VLLSALAKHLAEKVEPGTDLLLLDEPTSSLDEENAGLCLDLVRRLHREGRTVILATHDVDIALRLAERVCVLRRGRLVADIAGVDLSATTPEGLASIVAGARHPL
jgi:energy-coupling factor transporter ATP-binding protein EcfA2